MRSRLSSLPALVSRDDGRVKARPRDSWDRLPRRVYLDSSTLQTIHDFGGHFFDGETLTLDAHQRRVDGLSDEIWALAGVLEVNVRGAFQYVVTGAALDEVVARGVPSYTRWAVEMADLWDETSYQETFTPSENIARDPSFGMISMKDRALLQECLDAKCDAFLTMERRLVTAASFVERRTHLRIMRPSEYWRLIHPWAALFR